MYDNISSLNFQEGNNKETLAMAMVSAEGEVMNFKHPVPAEGRVEDWMTLILEEMRRTNRLITKEAVFTYCSNGVTRLDLFVCLIGGGIGVRFGIPLHVTHLLYLKIDWR